MPTTQRTAEITWDGTIARGDGTVRGHSGGLPELPVTIASRMGEPEGRTSPEELIAAAHATCFAMALGSMLEREGNPPDRLHAVATVTLETGDTIGIRSSRLVVDGVVPGIDQARFRRTAEEAGENCPVSRALAGNLDIEVEARLRKAAA
jgi:osmotically inducible protein OsmC